MLVEEVDYLKIVVGCFIPAEVEVSTPVNFYDGSPIDFEVVVAEYNEDLSWLLQVYPNEKVTIYNKGKYDLSKFNLPSNYKIINLPNIGRESHTYIWHIIENYNNLADRIFFTQGDPRDHPMLPFPHYKDLNTSSCHKIIANCMYQSLSQMSDQLSHENWSATKWSDIELMPENLIEFKDEYINKEYKMDIIPVVYGANFATTKAEILKNSIEKYKKIISTLGVRHPISVHYIERLWAILFL